MKKSKRLIAVVLLVLSLCTLPVFAAESAAPSLKNFKVGKALGFTDVDRSDWFYTNVSQVTALGLMKGDSVTEFLPEGKLTVAEAVTVAARFHAIYHSGSTKTLEQMPTGKWYRRYFDYLASLGMIDEGLRYDAERRADRELVAVLLAQVVEDKDLAPINLIDGIPDAGRVLENSLLPLYRAGVLTGNDQKGTFAPASAILRCELAAILSRLALPKLRRKIAFVPTGKGDMKHFVALAEYDGRFRDVPKKAWFYPNVALCYEYGLMQGEKKNYFNAEGEITLSEVAAAAARFHCIYLTGDTEMLDRFSKGKVLYQSYYDYLFAADLLPASFLSEPESAATREQALGIFARILAGALEEINTVAAIPDYVGSYYEPILHLYRAGVLTGNDGYGSLCPEENVQRCEIAAILSRVVDSGLREKFTLKTAPAAAFVYGKSGAGRSLTGWRIGNGKKALVLTFAIHGWEDNFPRDGQVLTDTAYVLIEELKSHPEWLRGWTVYVLPCCNPDGLLDGSSHDGQGRRTLYSYNDAGKLISQGIDLNRSFPYGYKSNTSNREYNGPRPLSSPEAQALQTLLLSVREQHSERYFVDVHGWYNQIITKSGETALQNAFLAYFPHLQKEILGGGGYISAYAHSLGYHAALFEFPQNVYSAADFAKSGYQQRFISCIRKILEI